MFTHRGRHASTDAHETALDCLEAGIRASLPAEVVSDAVSLADAELRIHDAAYDLASVDRIVVLGGGKAAGGVARALENVLGDRLAGGIVVTTAGANADRVDVHEGDHPTPSERNVAGTRRVLEFARDAGEETLVLAVVTGGASALWCRPADGLSLADLQATTDALLASGASIDEINAVRKHCSAIKGGQLAREAAPATVATLAISDVVGDDPSVIGSGPTVPDPSTFEDALEVCERYDLEVPDAVAGRLERGVAGEFAETPGRDDPAVRRAGWHLLANARTAIDAAREAARERGYETIVLSSRIRGEASEAGRFHAAVAEEIATVGDPVTPPAVVLSGGETTVTIHGDGTGGPNQEFSLAVALELAATDTDAVCGSADTDGIDGPTDACGAIVDRETIDDASEARGALADNDAYTALEDADALLETGYTGTNVNDLRVLVVDT
ncbi:glycerate kinase type-2 family protein [Natrialbaceae archaeon AArc-T1-2]|uniref:glycerate kinase type-2 family protein n=1 Tax=Natrialbaceae archaeon AArc-T1-2 TaxID=3053904 RepID=UPI00255ADE84|nr:DUF4147 domain-containing protein [Natrialbaceae archaeon AArc-T1-2]WIV67636.1 DUF4147 domain-containing protein [Natrialbaceae archaeon AArc-T1-2]